MKECETCYFNSTCGPIIQMTTTNQNCQMYRPIVVDYKNGGQMSGGPVPKYDAVTRMIGAANIARDKREQHDFYATDPAAAEWLVKIEQLAPNIWEPACGQGHLSKVFEKHGFNVLSTDLFDRGFGIGGVDFLSTENEFDGDIITNPPFSLATKFVDHGLSLVPDGRKVIMFLKVQFLEGQKRRAFFERTPLKTVWISSRRINCYRNGVETLTAGGMMALAWFIWEKGYQGEPVIKWFG